MSPCSLCGSSSISQHCIRCQSRIELFSQLTSETRNILRSKQDQDTSTPRRAIGLVGGTCIGIYDRIQAKDCGGTCFKAAVEYSNNHLEETYILTPTHGMVSPYALIIPGRKTMAELNTADSIKWAEDVVSSLVCLFPLQRVSFTILAGSWYADPLVSETGRQKWPWTFDQPFRSKPLHSRMKWLQTNVPRGKPLIT